MRNRRVGLLAGKSLVFRTACIAILALAGVRLPAAVVQGVAVEYATGRPLARASISLSSARDTQRTALADGQGRFVFTGLPAGAYQLSASRKGYAAAKYGQASWNGPGTSIVLEQDGQFTAELRLHRLGVITGQISDENGVGIPDLPVYAYRASQRIKLSAMAQTDDRGQFRLAGLEPGRYYVRSGPVEVEGKRGYLPTYFGQTARATDAQVVRAELDLDVISGNIEPLTGSLGSLFVSVHGPAGAQAKLTLFTDMGKRDASVGSGGTSKFDQLPPGVYDLVAEAPTGSGIYGAATRVAVGRDQEHITMDLLPAPTLRVTCGEKSGKSLQVAAIGVFIRRPNYAEDSGSQRVSCGDEVTLSPGEWELGALPPAGYYLIEASNLRPGPEGFRLQLQPRQTLEARLWFSSEGAVLSGKVRTEDGALAIGAPIFVRGVSEDLQNRLGGVRVGRTNEKGEFELTGLPPGEYEAASTFEAQDTSEILWAPGWGKPVSLESGKSKEVELTLRRATN